MGASIRDPRDQRYAASQHDRRRQVVDTAMRSSF